MKKNQWKKESRMCSCCHDKTAISHRHGYDPRDNALSDDLCPRCARDLENRLMAEALAQQAKVLVKFVRPVYEPMHEEAAFAAAV